MPSAYLPLLWLGVAVALVLLELATYQLVAIWFALGAVVTLLATVAGVEGLKAQLTIFALASALALASTRPLVKKLLRQKHVPTNADQLIGQCGQVIVPISPSKKGRIHVGGLDWSAAADVEIPLGAQVEVLAISGATLTVRPKKS